MIFVRPWMLLLLLVPFVIKRMQKKWSSDNPWQHIISPKLLPYLLVGYTRKTSQKISWFLIVLWSLLSVAAAGPAFEKAPVPSMTFAPATVLLVDLNSLNKEKLAQLKIKLLDLLDNLKAEQVGLVLYDQKGYVAVPVTQDLDIIRELVPTLSPSVLPAVGNRLEKGVEKAIEILQNTGLNNGRILLLTGGGVETKKAQEILKKTSFKIGVLGIGDEKNGAPILSADGRFLRDENGNLQLAQLNADELSRLGSYVRATPLDKDIHQLLAQTKSASPSSFLGNEKQKNNLFQADEWKDLGVYLVLACLPFLSLLFRKGFFFVLLICFMTLPSFASPFIRADQKNYEILVQGNEAYQKNSYEQALNLFQQAQGIDAMYNQGNALAQLGRLQEAIAAYNAVLKEMPSHQEAAFNKAYLEKMLNPQPPQQQENQQNQESADKKSQSDSKEPSQEDSLEKESESQKKPSQDSVDKQSQKQEKADKQNQQNQESSEDNLNAQNDPESQSETQNKNEAQSTSVQEKEQEAQMTPSDAQDSQSPSQSEELNNKPSDEAEKQILSQQEENTSFEADQETQQILNRLKKDPYRLLRNRLYEQNRRGP